jgi:SAM-dependent methyltransferase
VSRPAGPARTPRPARLLRAPAVQALLIQCVAMLPTLFLVYLLASLRLPVTLLTVALLQGALAALATCKLGLAPWWRPIQFLFPVALLGASALQLPPSLFLAAFLFLLVLYWSTFRTQVPYYPSRLAVWQAVEQLLPAGPVRMIDIGSGLGGLVLYLARRRPDAACTGIELAPLPWAVSALRARLPGGTARFIRGDYEWLDFNQFDVVFAYLSPAAMDGLWRKASAEMRPGAVLLSYEFAIAARTPDRTLFPIAGGPPLYVWYF